MGSTEIIRFPQKDLEYLESNPQKGFLKPKEQSMTCMRSFVGGGQELALVATREADAELCQDGPKSVVDAGAEKSGFCDVLWLK